MLKTLTTTLGAPHQVGRGLRAQHVRLLEARVDCHPDVPLRDVRLPSTPRIGAFAVSISLVRSSAMRADPRRCRFSSVMSWPRDIRDVPAAGRDVPDLAMLVEGAATAVCVPVVALLKPYATR